MSAKYFYRTTQNEERIEKKKHTLTISKNKDSDRQF